MEAGRVTDRYSLDRKIGHGGSGAVWLGRDEVLGRTVAIKQVGYPPGSVDVDLIRAEREARLAARVNHPNVVAVFDLVETEAGYWLVMEYVEGTTLAATIDQRGALSPDYTARVMARVADALAAAHAAGIVHRDVKPSNILLGADDTVKLTDFGIARAVADASLTQTGLVTGSPAYLSPEVASGRSATPASDVWSLGASMFHALAGRPPYDIGDNVMGAMYRIVHEEPPRLRTAGWLGPLLEMTMTREPRQRPAMAEVRDYLRAPATARETQLMPAVPPPPAPPVTPPTTPPPTTSPIAPAPASEPAPVSPDGQGRDRRTGLLAAVGGGVVALVVLVAAVLLLGNNGDGTPAAHTGGGSSASGGGGTSNGAPPSGSSQSTAPPPTTAELESFAETYLQTASKDPAAGFDQLTPAYQQRSPQYQEFWGSVSGVKLLDITADPSNMRVTYTYSYHLKGNGSEKHTDRVTLYLVQKGDQLLIADATSSPV